MRAINKGNEPTSLKSYRATPNSQYTNMPKNIKNDIRSSLIKEQGGLCAYCMGRISEESMRIEHWRSQSRYPARQLDFDNMLGCCNGNEGTHPKNQHCDVRKSEADISFNPADPAHHARMDISYMSNGRIRSSDPGFDDEINTVLNLNLVSMQHNRKAVLDAIRSILDKNQGACTKSQIRGLLNRWQNHHNNGELCEYCDVAIYYLNRKLKTAR